MHFFILPSLFCQDTTGIDKERIRLENDFNTRIENALSKLINPKSFVSIVNVELESEKIEFSQVETSKKILLPGVPDRKKIGEEEITPAGPIIIYNYKIKKITVILTLDIGVSVERENEIKEMISALVQLNEKRGDKILIKRTDMYIKEEVREIAPATQTKKTLIQKIISVIAGRRDIIWIFVILFISILFSIFLFGPLRKFFVELTNILPKIKVGGEISAAGMSVMGGKTGGGEGGGAGGGAWGKTTLALEKPGIGGEEYPFTFVTKKNIDKLVLLLKDKTPDQIAVIVNYLPAELSSELLSKIDPNVKAEVLKTIPWERQFTPEEVLSLDKELRRNINYLIGGTDVILNIYESADKPTQEQMMEILLEHRPEVAEKIRQKYIEFEDLILFDNATLRSILREVPLRSLAIAFQDASQELKEKIFEVLPEGMAQILKEEIEYSQTMTQARVMEEQRRIIQLIRHLQEEGRIEIPVLEVKPLKQVSKRQVTSQVTTAGAFGQKQVAGAVKTAAPSSPTSSPPAVKTKPVPEKPDISNIAKLLEQRRLQKKK